MSNHEYFLHGYFERLTLCIVHTIGLFVKINFIQYINYNLQIINSIYLVCHDATQYPPQTISNTCNMTLVLLLNCKLWIYWAVDTKFTIWQHLLNIVMYIYTLPVSSNFIIFHNDTWYIMAEHYLYWYYFHKYTTVDGQNHVRPIVTET